MPRKSTPPNRVCETCGKPFRIAPSHVARGHGRYCSYACRPTPRGESIVRNCLVCGQSFKIHSAWLRKSPNTGSYCSNDCRNKARRTGEDRSCQRCGTSFYVQQATSPRRFCSVDCQREARRRDCEACGVSFIPTTATGRFCSHACRNVGHRVFEVIACDYCGKSVKSYPDYPRRYCSNKCQGAALLRDNPEWDGTSTKRPQKWRQEKWRTAVLNRDGRTCRSCGSTERLHAHHVKSWSAYPELRFDVDNGLTLCQKCHRALHNEMRPAQLRLGV